MALKNYTLGRGEVYLSELDDDQGPTDFRYVGNTTELNITLETEQVELTSPDTAAGEVVATAPTTTTRSGTMIIDDIQAENLALFIFGSVGSRATGAGADGSDQTTDVPGTTVAELVSRRDNGEWYPIGVTAANPVGYRNLSKLTVGSLTANTDYEVDLPRGRFKLLNTSAVAALSGDLTVTYNRSADTTTEVRSGAGSRQVAMKFFENNARGQNRDWTFPVMTLSPNGDLALKADEWRAIPFSLSILKPNLDAVEAIYINDVPLQE